MLKKQYQGVEDMSFFEWLQQEYGKTWEELFCKVSDETLIQYTEEYEQYCAAQNIEPKWT